MFEELVSFQHIDGIWDIQAFPTIAKFVKGDLEDVDVL